MMTPRFETLAPKKIIGLNMRMSLLDNRTGELWRSFMPRRKEIPGTVSTDLMSLQVYHENYFNSFNPGNVFTKWAGVEVVGDYPVPEGMETLKLPGGLYAVFLHKGPASAGAQTFQYIFQNWLPSSGYQVDQRPHFELLGEKYKNEDPSSEEEFWIPVKK